LNHIRSAMDIPDSAFPGNALTSALGQTVIVENRPGGVGGSIGANAVATADPDGYTLLLCPVDVLTQVPLVYKNIDYDPIKSFAPIVLLMTSPYVIVVNPAVPVRTVQELATYAKANPGKISFASPGHGTYPHLMGELFKRMTGAEIIHVPYRGAGPAISDLQAGQVQMYFETGMGLLPHIDSGRLRALAVASETRSRYFPDLPTTAESGFPRLLVTFTQGPSAPPGTPGSIIDRLNGTVNNALKSADIQDRLTKLAATAEGGSAQSFAALANSGQREDIGGHGRSSRHQTRVKKRRGEDLDFDPEYDAAAQHALQSANLRRPAIPRYAGRGGLLDLARWSGRPSTAAMPISSPVWRMMESLMENATQELRGHLTYFSAYADTRTERQGDYVTCHRNSCAPTACIASGGRFHPESCRLLR
jgi:tripartite-type tricarboxylate transporter receptor subunit TctC